MKYLIGIFTILLLFCFSCRNENKIVTLDKSDSFKFKSYYYNGDTIKIKLSKDYFDKYFKNNNKHYDLNLMLTIYKPYYSDYDTKIYSLKTTNGNFYECLIVVPDTCSEISLRFLDHKTLITGISDIQNIMIFKKDNSPNIGTYDNILHICKSNIELNKSVFEYQKYFPNDLGIYASKWSAGKANNIINRDTLKSDLKMISNNYKNHNDLKLIEFIGESYINQDINYNNYIEFSKKYKSYLLNNWAVATLILDIIHSPFINQNKKNKKAYLKIIQNLFVNNPNTYFEQSIIKQGGYRQFQIDSDIYENSLINRINKHYDTYCNYSLLHYLFIEKKYSKKYNKYCDLAFNDILDSNILVKGKTNTLSSLYFKSSIIDRLCEYYIANNNYKKINILLKYYSKLNLNQLNEYSNLYDLSCIKKSYYKIINNYDSVGVYYLHSCYYMGEPINTAELLDIYQNSRKYNNNAFSFEDWSLKMRELSFIKLRTNLIELPKSLSTAKYKDKQIILGQTKLKVLEFFSSSCSPCIVNLKSLKKLSMTHSEKLQIIYLSGDRHDIANKILQSCDIKDVVPENSGEFIRLLGVNSYPCSIFLDKNNKIIARVNGGGNDMTKEITKFIKNHF